MKTSKIPFTFVTVMVVAVIAIRFIHPVSASDEQEKSKEASKRISSNMIKTDAGERVVIQEVLLNARIEKVWDAYTTDDGWSAWASPAVKINLRAGGTIQTHYTPNAKIGDAGTNTLHIVNYVPQKVLTLRAELSERWPDIMKQDADNLMNVIVFEAISDNRTRILSYGVGYRDDPAYDKLMEFFIPANEGLYAKLIDYVENGKRASFDGH